MSDHQGVQEESATAEQFEAALDSIRNVPLHLQRLIDTVVKIQEVMPMPQEGWEAFVRDIEHTNEKRGFNLIVPTSD